MDFFADITLMIIMIPTLLIMFFYEYPIRWQDRKFIFGVRNRDEFKEENVSGSVTKIVSATRKQALIIMMVSFLVMGLILLIPDSQIRMIIWMLFILADLVLFGIPFMRSNLEMKSLKRQIGIKSEQGTTYTDLKSAGQIRALKPIKIIIPNIITLTAFILALLYDLGLIDIAGKGESFALTSMTGSFLFISLILLPVAILMDRIRNEVISSDSNTNNNYNRAKKKVFADMFVAMSWINAAVVVLYALLLFFMNSDIVLIIQIMIYMFLLMAALALFAKRIVAVNRHYRSKTTIDIDDDDKWILGSFYYNPDDRRLNVEKRMGIGGTINIAHPAGKAIMAVSVIFLVLAIASVILITAFARTGMKVSFIDDSLVCNQVIDYYKIPLADIEDAELCDMSSDFHLSRQTGIGMEPVFIGIFTVNGEKNCNIFLNTKSDNYIKFKAGGTTYCISGNNSQETGEIFGKISDHRLYTPSLQSN